MQVRGRVIVIAVIVAALLLPVAGWAQGKDGLPAMMPVSELKPGMRGIGRTVIKGQKIEHFDFEVLGILNSGLGAIPVKHLILFRISGPITDTTGGTAAGMSGSPLYINGKLIGALSAGYLYQPGKRELALATPIEEMIRVLDIKNGAASPWPRVFVADRPIQIDRRPVTRFVIASTLEQAKQIDAARALRTTAFVPATFPASISGASPRALRIVQRVLGLQQPLFQGLGGSSGFHAEPIAPGSSVGVLQVRGDISYGGICTVTLRISNRLLVCGHPWELLGEVEYGLTTSDIVTVVRTLERPFKEGNLGELIGKIDQDRGPGIRGVIGQMPRMFAVRVAIKDLDRGKTVNRGFQVVRRPDLAKLFATAMTLTALEQARDQVTGGGTVRVRTTIRGKGLPRVVTRENLIYNTRDMAMAALLELPDALNFMFYNDLVTVNASDVSIEVSFTAKRLTALIADVQAERREVSPGESLRVRLMIRPFQEEAVTSQVIDVPIPRNFPRGPAVLVVRSSGLQIPLEFPLEERVSQQLMAEPSPLQARDLDEAIQLFEDFGKYTDLLIQIVPFGLPPEGAEFLKFDVFAGRLIRTEWVLQGEVQIPVLIR
ncbi:MAG TPA: SpoIVB peptidase S55 domain-containing protein [bacterium]|nr:SpoIVB peptidase S55 domain-containing protein [bacterium]